MKHNHVKLFIFFLTTISLITIDTSQASPTQYWLQTSYSHFTSGKSKGVMITSDGKIISGLGYQKIDIKGNAPSFFKKILQYYKQIFLFSGRPAAIWTIKNKHLHMIYKLKEIAITNAIICNNNIYFTTIGDSYLYKLINQKPFKIAHIDEGYGWSLACVKNSLYIGAGPKGGLYKLSNKKLKKVWDSKENHIISMKYDGKYLYLGTSPNAKLFEFDPSTQKARLLYDFEGNEISSIEIFKNIIYVAANQLSYNSIENKASLQKKTVSKKPLTTKSTKKITIKKNLPYREPIKGQGYLMRLTKDGVAISLISLTNSYITKIFIHQGLIYISTSGEGDLFVYYPNNYNVAKPLNLPQSKLLDVILMSKGGFAITGDKGAIYKIGQGIEKQPTYTSKVFDAGLSAKFGTFQYKSSGKVIIETRSGMSEKPDDTWSEWKKLSNINKLSSGFYTGTINSPASRFFQYRVLWKNKGKGSFEYARIFYKPLELPAKILNINVSSPQNPSEDKGNTEDKGQTKNLDPNNTPKKHIFNFSWEVDNPQNNTLFYKVWLQRLGQKAWIPLNDGDPITKSSIDWDGSLYPDGLYKIKVMSFKSNDKKLSYTKVSDPFLVDNLPPKIKVLSIIPSKQKVLVKFAAIDSYSRITAVSIRLDQKLWIPLEPTDGLFDANHETFNFTFEKLKSGYHLIQIQVQDEGGNIFKTSQEFRIKK